MTLVVKNLPATARGMRCGFDPWTGRSPGGGHGNLIQYCCLENPTDRGAWRARVHSVSHSQTQWKWQRAHTQTDKDTEAERKWLLSSHTTRKYSRNKATLIFLCVNLSYLLILNSNVFFLKCCNLPALDTFSLNFSTAYLSKALISTYSYQSSLFLD